MANALLIGMVLEGSLTTARNPVASVGGTCRKLGAKNRAVAPALGVTSLGLTMVEVNVAGCRSSVSTSVVSLLVGLLRAASVRRAFFYQNLNPQRPDIPRNCPIQRSVSRPGHPAVGRTLRPPQGQFTRQLARFPFRDPLGRGFLLGDLLLSGFLGRNRSLRLSSLGLGGFLLRRLLLFSGLGFRLLLFRGFLGLGLLASSLRQIRLRLGRDFQQNLVNRGR